MGCGNSKSATTVVATAPPVKPGPANEGNNNQDENQPGKISPQNDATETSNTKGIYINS
jgi:hypothetical protein